MTEQSEVRQGPGRPRDPQLDEQVLRATQELLVEQGFQATTIQGVARRAGVVATSIYRRWPNKIHLVEDAIFALDTGVVPQPTGDIGADLLAWTRLFFAAATHPAARSGIPGLLSAYHDDEQSYQRLRERGEGLARVALRATIDAAIESGQVSPTCDPDLLFEFLRGATLLRALTRGDEDGERFCRQTADALVTLAIHHESTT
ncbi:TetR/AcrR family transcriptional regulator [Nocardia asteroides NBRC 15531]|uniref:TetR family transcriptional regulator n=1 Tax=Nocardia asteroides NBRC 15531 TaxID=1110697 RepID=U5EIA9_NOCAS|nr:TetR/AcrR family transcriptional regulator [Nocardia asteroides]TLF63335.1 TetR/AcrR family transcriptional regulator [Nocardia asteroides NBRC 15531]UGT47242.1 TetR/AcrR family transcriptional regulator [Nocardia asteroides]SFM75135.1 transcriptional regulator, TetR family [Nocardia asteroides]VEG33871.1 Bacterial regulatory proteins, tetR family [Nocardia asteroides]GAD87030.1 putative TetR family transcriptional regulator [Nocardia asteroides NBRC 15531]